MMKWLHIFGFTNNNLPSICFIDERTMSNGKQILVEQLEDTKPCLQIFERKAGRCFGFERYSIQICGSLSF